MKKRRAIKRAKSKKAGGENEQFVPYSGENASLLEEPDKQRYIELSSKAQRTDTEEQERWRLVEKAHAHRELLERFQDARPHIDRQERALKAYPNDLALQREYIRSIVAPCYPSFDRVLVAWQMEEKYPFLRQNPARSGLETVLFFMDSTFIGDELKDPKQRVRFLEALSAMLEPLRKLRNGESLDLHREFEFKATGRGNIIQAKHNTTLAFWGTPCFDVHLVRMAGIKPAQARARVAAVHNIERDALRSAYNKWIRHPVRAEVMSHGDEHAKEMLTHEPHRALVETAYPPLPREHRPHRPR